MASNRIHAKGPFQYEEYVSTAVTLLPGNLVEMTSAGYVQKHSTAWGRNERMFVQENALVGKDVNTVLPVSEVTPVLVMGIGSQCYALLADGESVAIGDRVGSDGAGCLQKFDEDSAGTDDFAVGVALEALDLSADSLSTAQLLLIRVGCH